ncbi:hypothetical protein OSTOST_25504 [Ostertagia ostertagi]
MKDKLRVVSAQVPELASELRAFHARTKDVSNELDIVQSACQKENLVWELLSLPSGIADKLVEARSFLLEELFNKFSGPLDLASSIQVVNNVRKNAISHTYSTTCLHFTTQGYNHPEFEFAIRAIEIYRDCMYDTLVLYLAVFPESETARKDLSLDPRWETWPSSAPSSVLGHWTARNITRLLDLICRTDMKSGVDMCTVWSKLMSLAASLGRMGLDFRSLVVNSLVKVSLERFSSAVRAATNK